MLNRRDFASLITDMLPDDRVDLLKHIFEDQCETLLPAIAQAEREDIRKLSSHPEGTAWAAMTSDYATLPAELSVADAIASIKTDGLIGDKFVSIDPGEGGRFVKIR
ncbi:MAG: magnesium transporter MgtE N-terminal domain-containing protein [Candidatus Binatia bacterium]